MEKKYELGIFLGGGGNTVFFTDGILKVLEKNGINIDYSVGISASSGMMLGHIFNCENHSFNVFSNRIRKNKKNFYFFRKKHFPHDEIYRNSVSELLLKYRTNKNKRKFNYSIIASQMPKKYSKTKATISIIVLILKYYCKINLTKTFRNICNVSPLVINSSDRLKNKELINIIMGSSTIYPFIDLYYYKNKLLLDADFLDLNYDKCLSNCKKGIVIYSTMSKKSYIKDNILHIFPKKNLPFDVLDYTNDKELIKFRKEGEKEANEYLNLIFDFLDK
jgi:hypothetical protein